MGNLIQEFGTEFLTSHNWTTHFLTSEIWKNKKNNQISVFYLNSNKLLYLEIYLILNLHTSG